MNIAQNAFLALQGFWQPAFDALSRHPTPRTAAALQGITGPWLQDLWLSEGLDVNRMARNFSYKLPEPYHGAWLTPEGALNVADKVVVALVNPGDGVPYDAYWDTTLSAGARSLWSMLSEYYSHGAISHGGVQHGLMYKRELAGEGIRGNSRRFAWAWWGGQLKNMLRSLDLPDDTKLDEQAFLTLELVAYQSRTSSKIDSTLAQGLKSTRLVVDLISALAQLPVGRPRAIVLVNKRRLWEQMLQSKLGRSVNFRPACSTGSCRDAEKHSARFFRLSGVNGPPVFNITSQSMKFPARTNGGSCLFP